ncbi:MAG: bifunctional phosphoribosyl-AMP cyclohydrolase/phosphoribosyl-ATP diphosphatase HisIE [Reichenbachiella sp.]|uniref:bifunctional phosphoribosyl-AMP cyclohydrolase/phosphoribosyl-ATP diphosphatase HisIE n=1 Tax=Reichenbachiella sp. TaxID=2184521 RepID=UPI0032646B0E
MKIDFKKNNDLVPAVIQDAKTKTVLMLGYMNEEALQKTQESEKVTFYSRSKDRLWTKGEESGNFLELVDIKLDCDQDTLLIQANPVGPTCHKGTDTCWGESNRSNFGFLSKLEAVIQDRYENPDENSYTSSLFQKGINKVAQKVGEEAVEVVIEAKDDNKELFLNESADLLYHYMILLRAKGYDLEDVVKILEERH